MKIRLGMYNVVFYDGCDSFVVKFILQVSSFEEQKESIYEYYSGNGEVLKIDFLHDMSFENLLAILTDKRISKENELITERFKTMYF